MKGSLTIDRAKLAEILNHIVRNVKPKDKDPILRRTVYIDPGEKCINVCGTNELMFILFREIECSIDGDLEPFAPDLIKLSRLASSSKSDIMCIKVDSDRDKIQIKAGSTADIGYITGSDYAEILGTDGPITTCPDEIEDYTHVPGLKDFRGLSQILLGCVDPAVPHLSGVYTNGDGLFMTTDTFKAMELVQEAQSWGFRAVVPPEFFTMLDALPGDDCYLLWAEGVVWARNESGTIAMQCAMRDADKFPEAQISKIFGSGDDDQMCVILDAGQLGTVLDVVKGFLQKDVVCKLTFRDKSLVITGEGDNRDRIKDAISYSVAKGSAKVKDHSLSIKLETLNIITKLYDSEFELLMFDEKSPLITRSKDLGINLLLMPYIPRGG